ncbi:MAG: nitrogenase iron-molybdenum cofactor biosynthesis protein NifN [Sulfurovaceae bacterium]|nr:nitrogenase iron-molybdenum cofactor biosynthesis protein NifN [Sulfurovaceae bacterium]
MNKPLEINPLKLSQPMGALLAFLGIKNCMPLMHGAQGCASFSKVFFTRHFNDPIAIQTTAVNDITAVIDGGDYSISEAVKNITAKVTPELIGLFTTGLTETKGDDIRGVASILNPQHNIVYVHTPDFEGGLESGYTKTIEAIIEQLVEPQDHIEKKITLIPHVSMTPLEVERVKEQIELFGWSVFALPDISESLDGHLGLKQGALSSNGISVSEIQGLGSSHAVITIGASVRNCGEKLCSKNQNMQHLHFDTIGGLRASDAFYGELISLSHVLRPHASIMRWRKRLQDALLDTHFILGGLKVVLACEPDQMVLFSSILTEAGAKIKAAISSTKSDALDKMPSSHIIIGDLDDAERFLDESTLLITNFHGERLSKKYKTALIMRGFPDYETLGNQLKDDILYQGSTQFLFEVANCVSVHSHHN